MADGVNEVDSSHSSWINRDLLEHIMSIKLKKDVAVTKFEVREAVPKGENYLSVLHRVEIDYKEDQSNEENKYSMIIKSPPEGEVMREHLEDIQGFQKESFMYTDVLPIMYRFIRYKKGDVDQFSASWLPCSKGDKIIVMEDLKHLDYKMGDRKVGLDLDHCKIALRGLARFHVASFAAFELLYPKMEEMYVEGIYKDHQDEEKRRLFERSIKNDLESLASAVETWPGYEKYGDKLRNLIPTCAKRMADVVKPKRKALNVVNHGDFWVNNVLFHYNPQSGKVDDVRFIDFQLARYSSPALDLQYFMCICPNDDVRFQQKDTLLEEYYSEFTEYWRILVQGPYITLEQLKEEYEEKNFFGLIIACTILSYLLAEKEDLPDTKNLSEDDLKVNAFNKKALTEKRFKEIFQKLLVYYDEKGII